MKATISQNWLLEHVGICIYCTDYLININVCLIKIRIKRIIIRNNICITDMRHVVYLL